MQYKININYDKSMCGLCLQYVGKHKSAFVGREGRSLNKQLDI